MALLFTVLQSLCVAPFLSWLCELLASFWGNRSAKALKIFFAQLQQHPSGSSLKLPLPEETKAAWQWLRSCCSCQCIHLPKRTSVCALVFPLDSTGLLALWGQCDAMHLASPSHPSPSLELPNLSLAHIHVS